MFDSGGIAGKLAQVHALLADVAVASCSDTSGPAAYEALMEAIPASGQLDLVVCLLGERMDRSGVLLSHRRASALVEMARQSLDFGTGHEGSVNKPHLVLLCRKHHQLVHQGKLHIDALGNQSFRFTNTTEQPRT